MSMDNEPLLFIRAVLGLRDCRYIAAKLYHNGSFGSPMSIYDSDGVMTKHHIELHCSLSDRALYEQMDDDDQRYTDYWIGRLLCQ